MMAGLPHEPTTSLLFPLPPRHAAQLPQIGAVLTTGLASLGLRARAQTNANCKLRIFQIGVGGIGELQRNGLKGHPQVEWAGFCDVDSRELEKIKKQFPDAWTVKDYREPFALRVDDFDAVIVDVPDLNMH